MEDWELDNFCKGRPGEQFPPFHTLTETELEGVRATIGHNFGITEWSDPHQVWLNLFKHSRDIGKVSYNFTGPDFQLEDVFQEAHLQHSETVYVDWGCFRDVDTMAFSDFVHYFDDIYYNEEAISLFDETMSWVMYILHYGDATVVYAQARAS